MEVKGLLHRGAPDEALCAAFDRLLVSLNAEASAAQYLALAGFLCHSRPHLAERLLRRPVEGCFVLGATGADTVIRFGDAVSRHEWLASIAEPEGVRWLRERLPALRPLVDNLLAQCQEEFARRYDHPDNKQHANGG